VPGVAVRRDGQVLGEGLMGSAVPVDPGEHTIEASAPGRKAWKTTVKIDAKAAVTIIDVPELAVAPASESETQGGPGFWTGRRTAGVVIGGVGVVGLVLGSVFGGRALSKKAESNADNHCDAQNFCDPTGKSLRREGLTAGNISTASFILGGLAVAGGVVLVLTGAPRSTAKPAAAGKRPAVELAAGPGSVCLSGRW